jgi:hypothetical protein
MITARHKEEDTRRARQRRDHTILDFDGMENEVGEIQQSGIVLYVLPNQTLYGLVVEASRNDAFLLKDVSG